MKIHGPSTNGTSARKRNARFTLPRKERPENPETCAHSAHQIVGCCSINDIAGREMKRVALMAVSIGALAIDGGVHTMVAKDADEQAHIGEVRNILERDGVRRQQTCYHERQSRVFGSADWDCAMEVLPPRYANSIHCTCRK